MSNAADDGSRGSLRLGRALDEARGQIAAGQASAAATSLQRITAAYPDSASAWNEYGRALNNLKRLDDAIRAFREAVRLDEDFALAWNHLGHVLRAAGAQEEARHIFARAVELDPGLAPARRNLALALLAAGEHEAAVKTLEGGLAGEPNDAPTRQLIGDIYLSRDRLADAEHHYLAALSFCPTLAGAAAGLGCVYQADGRHAAAGENYRKALAADPANPVAKVGLAAILGLEGSPEVGLELLEGLLDRPAPGATVATTGARLLRQLGRASEALPILRRVDEAGLADNDTALLAFTYGDLLHDAGDHAAAFARYRQANSVGATLFDRASFVRTVDRLTSFFTRERLARLEDSGNDTTQPVFIVGVPRSGTTLVEHVLAAHSDVIAGGERTIMFDIVRELSRDNPDRFWPQALTSVSGQHLARLAARYLSPVGEALRKTDKLTANFLNLGLIRLLFPRAKVVYCRRNPMDTGLSCYRQNFRSAGMAFASRLEDIGLYQRGCRKLMSHWQSVIDLPVHVVEYEAFVTDFEEQARALVDFVGLPWQSQCLHPERVTRMVTTASYHQVRRSVNPDSVGSWRCYAVELEALRLALDAPWKRVGA